MARAISSFPVPVSPRIRTVQSAATTLRTWASTFCNGPEEPTISSDNDTWLISSRRAAFSCCSLSSTLLPVLYIGTRDVPPHDLSLVVSKRVGTNQEPAIGSVAAAQAHSTSLAAPLINERSIYALTLSKSSGCTSGTLFL